MFVSQSGIFRRNPTAPYGGFHLGWPGWRKRRVVLMNHAIRPAVAAHKPKDPLIVTG